MVLGRMAAGTGRRRSLDSAYDEIKTRTPCVGVVALAAALACSTTQPATSADPRLRPLGPAEITALIEARVPARAAWAQAVYDALAANGQPSNPSTACAVLALIAQESGFQEDPVVPGLAKVVAARMERYQAKLGPLGGPLFRRLLAGRAPPDPRTFEERLGKVRTERDLDVVFRDMLAFYKSSYPATFDAVTFAGKLGGVEDLAELNPITTAGPMQVNVRFAEDWAREHHGDPARVRDGLYSRAGGVYYGTARLFAGQAAYPRALFRFADYNAGLYASRNAALQAQLARLTGKALVLDGDLLGYGKDGEIKDEDTQSMQALRLFRDSYAKDLSDRQLRRDARREKSPELEQSDTYRAIKDAFVRRFGTPPDYAILPQIALESPKLSRTRSTAWFAQAVDSRYQRCLTSAGIDPRGL
jgi:hypothetical protein